MLLPLPLLLLLLVAPLAPQALLLSVNDTTMAMASPNQAESVLTALLRDQAQRGNLGATYALESMTSDETLYLLKYAAGETPVPRADSVIVFSTDGRPLPILSSTLAAQPLAPGEFLDLGRGSVWQVRQRAYFSGESGYGAAYILEDHSAQTLEAVATWDDSGDRGRMVGVIKIEMPNMLGPLRHFSLDFRRLSDINQTTKLSMSEPKLPWLPVGLQVAFSQELRDTLFVRREATLGMVSRPKPGASSMVGIGWRELFVTAHGEKEGLLPYAQRNMQIQLLRSTFSDIGNPTHGVRLQLHATGGTLTGASLASHSGLLEATLRLEWLASLAQVTFSQHWLLQGVLGLGYEPGKADFARIGGASTLRGYREDQFLTPWAIIARHELRYGAGRRGRVYFLADIGLIEGHGLLAGAGFGLRLPAGANLIMVELAWSADAAGRVDINAAKVHLRVLNILAGSR